MLSRVIVSYTLFSVKTVYSNYMDVCMLTMFVYIVQQVTCFE